MAAAYAAVLPDERTRGVAVIDLGFDSTGLVIYDGDSHGLIFNGVDRDDRVLAWFARFTR